MIWRTNNKKQLSRLHATELSQKNYHIGQLLATESDYMFKKIHVSTTIARNLIPPGSAGQSVYDLDFFVVLQ